MPSSALLTDLAELEDRVKAVIAERKPFGFDVETGYHGESREGMSLRAEANMVVSFQFTNSLNWARAVPLAFDSAPNVDNKAAAALFWQMLHATDDDGLPLGVAHGAVAELRWLSRFFLRNLHDHPLLGAAVVAARGYFPVRSCTLLESFAEGENKSHGLKAATLANFGYQMRSLADLLTVVIGRPPTEKEMNSVRFNVFDPADPEVCAYMCEDAVEALRHHLYRWPKVRNTFIYKLEMQVLPIVCEMADTGICYDWNLLRAKSAEIREFAEKLLAEVIEDFEALAGARLASGFNFNSSKQLADLLYVQCGMPVMHHTESGAPSVDAKRALPQLAAKYPEVKKYLSWKRLHDLRLKFLDIYEGKYSWAADGRAHPSLLQHGTIAGRFSCEAPNYQQSPGEYHYELRSGERFDFNFRDALVATGPGTLPWWALVLQEAGYAGPLEPDQHGYYILGFDYSQIELRVTAAEAGVTALVEAFARGEDVHKLTASLMLGIAMSQVTKAQRKDTGKRMNFATVYGQTAGGMAQQLGIPVEAAEALFTAYHAAYPQLKPYSRSVIRQARRDGYVITKFGRKVRIWEFDNPSRRVQAAGERTAGNAVIQGPATGEYVKMAMVRALRALDRAGLSDRVRLIMNVHDALEFEVRGDVTPQEVIAALAPAVVYEVKGPGVPWPPMVADWHIGRSWGSVKEITVLEDGEICLTSDLPEPEPKPAEPPLQEPAPPVLEPPARKWDAGPPRRVVIFLPASPAREQVLQLAGFLKSLPGENPVEIRMPDGSSIEAGFTCGLTPQDEGQASLAAGMPARVRWDQDAEGAARLLDGLAV
jgi:DNA polymerase I-like protein with 3'-5' exonuclease and polymerase domains